MKTMPELSQAREILQHLADSDPVHFPRTDVVWFLSLHPDIDEIQNFLSERIREMQADIDALVRAGAEAGLVFVNTPAAQPPA